VSGVINVVNGEQVLNPMIHCCDQCLKPILIYGRMIPCKHVFCLACAKQVTFFHIVKDSVADPIESGILIRFWIQGFDDKKLTSNIQEKPFLFFGVIFPLLNPDPLT
jgi:hypothetical protein